MDLFIRIGYGVMAAAIIICFVFSRRNVKELRFKVDAFAEAFLKFSNYISPDPPRRKLAVRRSGGGVAPLPLEQQPEEIRCILSRGRSEQAEKEYLKMEEAASAVKRHCRRNRRLNIQFTQPVEKLFFLAYTFHSGALDLNSIDDENKENAFRSFLEDQLEHRMVLLKRISREFNDKFLALNKRYDLKGAEKVESEPHKLSTH
ncbi:hypothetical protein SDC9_47355 [bioreactor metagenome]|uniref:Uncharacterized protein n=1 Tax=bioreactor metagenome TaxID=1076179 RepID=A0A644WC58_9ZZZZ